MANVNDLVLDFPGPAIVSDLNRDDPIPMSVRGNVVFSDAEVRSAAQFRLSIDVMPSDPQMPFRIALPPDQVLHSFYFRQHLNTGGLNGLIFYVSSLIVTAQSAPFAFETTNNIQISVLDEDPGTEQERREQPSRIGRDEGFALIYTFSLEDEVFAQAHLTPLPDSVTNSPIVTVPGSRYQTEVPRPETS